MIGDNELPPDDWRIERTQCCGEWVRSITCPICLEYVPANIEAGSN